MMFAAIVHTSSLHNRSISCLYFIDLVSSYYSRFLGHFVLFLGWMCRDFSLCFRVLREKFPILGLFVVVSLRNFLGILFKKLEKKSLSVS